MKNNIKNICYFVIDSCKFFIKLLKYNASIATNKDIEKIQYTLLRKNHVIEKGMSMRNPRIGFGQQKVSDLIIELNRYYELYFKENIDFMIYPLATIKKYIEYTKQHGVSIGGIEDSYDKLLKRTKLNNRINLASGTRVILKKEIIKTIPSNYEAFMSSRHSIRYFSKDIPDKELIDNALRIAQQTPSACNRQSWLVHIYQGKKALDLLMWQGGAKGFEDEIQIVILVTANLKAFLAYEKYQVYIDGGLYSMNLVNALHAQGLGTIPLSCGFHERKLKKLNSCYGIPENEIPILIIGIGCLLEEFKIAISSRKDVATTSIWHK